LSGSDTFTKRATTGNNTFSLPAVSKCHCHLVVEGDKHLVILVPDMGRNQAAVGSVEQLFNRENAQRFSRSRAIYTFGYEN
jgi:hypothetical protein